MPSAAPSARRSPNGDAAPGPRSVPRSSSSSGSSSGHRRASSSASMADSPLVQVNAGEPQQFKPKAVALYERLFTDERLGPGYWVEFFLLPANQRELERVIRAAHPLAAHEITLRTLVRAGIANIAGPPQNLPRPDLVVNALRILETTFTTTLALSTQPSAQPTATGATSTPASTTPGTGSTTGTAAASAAASVSVMQLLVGIDNAEALFDELTGRLWALTYHGQRAVAREATQFVLHVAAASLGTPLSSLFTTKNFFAAFVRVIDQFVDDTAAHAAMAAIGVLAALNQFDDDGANVYQQHIRDFIDEAVITKMIALVQSDLFKYTIQLRDPEPEATSGVGAWLSSFWRSEPPTRAEDETEKDAARTKKQDQVQREQRHELAAGPATLLPLYQFAVHNSLFASSLAASPALITLIEASAQAIQNAGQEKKQHAQAWLSLLVLRHLVETQFLALVDPAAAAIIRIVSPKTAPETSRRMPLAGIVDTLQQGLKTNAKKKGQIDWPLYHQIITVLYQVCAQLVTTRTMWPYHWQQLWQTLFSISRRFSLLTTPPNAAPAAHFEEQVLTIIAGMALRRDALDEEDWSSLFYRIVQTSQMFADLEKAFPQLKQQPPMLAITAMVQQFELKPEAPDLGLIIRQGVRAAGGQLVSERFPQFSEHRETILKKIFYVQIKEV